MERNVCQFYIVLGDKEFRPFNDGNVYINATGVLDNRLIYDSVIRAYNKKNSENAIVASEIVFLVPDMSFQARCQEIISELRIRGRIQILPSKEEEFNPHKVEQNRNNLANPEKTNQDDLNKPDTAKVVGIVDYRTKEEIHSQNIASSSVGSVGVEPKDGAAYSYNPINNNNSNKINLNNTSVKTLTKKPNKSAAFVSFPVVIFILSALLLIASAVLLFIVD